MSNHSITITPAAGPLRGTVRPPGSKSLTNRALVCAALAKGTSRLSGALDSDDTRVMLDSLAKLGIKVESSEDRTELTVHGSAGDWPTKQADLFVGNSGTTIRFLTAMVCLGQGEYVLDGIPRMRERPIGDLIDALNQLGANVRSVTSNGCPPVAIQASGLSGGTAEVRGSISSQYLSALLMAAPLADGPCEIRVEGQLVSQPYVRMTLEVMRSFGIDGTVAIDLSRFAFAGCRSYLPCEYAIEPDASAASYWWAAAAVTGGRASVPGLNAESLQGDVAFVECLQQMGCEVVYTSSGTTVTGPAKLSGVDVDMNAISDTAQTLAVVALFADGPTRIRGIGHIRHKETDRIGNLAIELRKLGATVEEQEDGLTVVPGPLRGATLETYDDHRMAMSFALAGLKVPGVEIRDPGCTAKTYPGYWDDFARLVATTM